MPCVVDPTRMSVAASPVRQGNKSHRSLENVPASSVGLRNTIRSLTELIEALVPAEALLNCLATDVHEIDLSFRMDTTMRTWLMELCRL